MNFETEFFLTKGLLKDLYNSKSLFNQAAQTDEANFEGLSLRRLNPKPLLQVIDLVVFPNSTKTKQPRYALTLFDGQDTRPSTIDTAFYDLLSNNPLPMLKIGTVFLLNDYKKIKLEDFVEAGEIDINSVELDHLVVLTDITIVAFTSPLHPVECGALKILGDSKPQNECRNDSTHTISQLCPSHSKSEWSIKCKLLEKTPLRNFENRKNGSFGKVFRLLLRDKTAQIEAVVFNDLCTDEKIKDLQVNKHYIISKGDIKLGQAKLKAWPDRVSVNFEIHVTNQTVFEHIQPKEKEEIIKTSLDPSIKNSSLVTIVDKTQGSESQLHEKFTRLDKLFLKTKESLVDVIGMIVQVGDIKKVSLRQELSLRNIVLKDMSSVEVSVAFWGLQAETFSIKKGSCILLNKAKLTNYGGISLSVLRFTEILEMKLSYDIPHVTELYSWYQNEFNSNEIQSFEVEECQATKKRKYF